MVKGVLRAHAVLAEREPEFAPASRKAAPGYLTPQARGTCTHVSLYTGKL